MERGQQVDRIIDFVNSHPESYASLAVCRRALDPGLAQVNRSTIYDLAEYLEQASSEEIAAYYSIVG
jgi:predicted AAA+ superfamily ATPase